MCSTMLLAEHLLKSGLASALRGRYSIDETEEAQEQPSEPKGSGRSCVRLILFGVARSQTVIDFRRH